ncbi:ferritin family protein [Desulfosarcina sp. OttesenSCG-928-A07]|nr:ferritin family protein [Desulfosarcina sp. OttesenSCG-928-G17]MDL2329768.1 ferritin family protein [Desulfosarcina sp. OttesenSCG-928-A07]
MMYDFNANEVFEIAEQIERNGAAFYRKAAAQVSDADSKTFLLELAAMEDDHEKTFATMRANLTDNEKITTVFDPNGDAEAYLKALADTRVFFDKEIDTSSMKSILTAAIQAEKDSIVFYLGMKEMVPESLGKSQIDSIIKEEMSHIRIISKRLVATR